RAREGHGGQQRHQLRLRAVRDRHRAGPRVPAAAPPDARDLAVHTRPVRVPGRGAGPGARRGALRSLRPVPGWPGGSAVRPLPARGWPAATRSTTATAGTAAAPGHVVVLSAVPGGGRDARYSLWTTSTMSWPASVGFSPTLAPASRRASILAWAVPPPPGAAGAPRAH